MDLVCQRECTELNGLHINEDWFIPEIIDPETGEVLPEGELGELVVTLSWEVSASDDSLSHERFDEITL